MKERPGSTPPALLLGYASVGYPAAHTALQSSVLSLPVFPCSVADKALPCAFVILPPAHSLLQDW